MTPDGKLTVELVRIARDIALRDVGLGLIQEDEMQYSLEKMSRKKAARLLRAEGLSIGKIAKVLGAPKSTIGDDLGVQKQNGNRPKPDENRPKPDDLEEPADDNIEAEISPEHYRSAFILRADQAVRFAFYSGEVDQEVVAAAREAATAWNNLLNKLTNGGSHGQEAV